MQGESVTFPIMQQEQIEKKIGRNEKCWCNSGKKYKHCHLDRQLQPRLSHGATIKGFRKSFDQKFCLHPQTANCSTKIIKAHSIQENLLYKIARDGKVYAFESGYDVLLKKGAWNTHLLGVNQASTFTGFCEYHDNATFAAIEKGNYEINEETAFLHSYRALCRELFGFKCSLDTLWMNRETDRGRSENLQKILQKQTDQWEARLRLGLRGLEEYKKRYDDILLSKEFHRCKSYQIETDKCPPFLLNGVTAAQCNFKGKKIQNFSDGRLQIPLTVNILPYNNDSGLISFAWVDECLENELLIESLNRVPRDQFQEVIRMYAFEFFENVYFSPQWWESLPESYREHVENKIMQRTHPNFIRNCSCMIPDGHTLCEFKASKIVTNLILIEVQCTICREWFSAGIRFGSAQNFHTATLVGNQTTCPNGHKTGINKENMRVRFGNDADEFIGDNTSGLPPSPLI